MKRALKKRVKAVLKNTPSSDGSPMEQLNVVNTKINRQARTKAALIGLAISMGATSLLVTRQSDQAQAAAPVGSEKAASATPTAPDNEVKFAPTKLETPRVSSANVPENPVIVEPTAISQVPGLEAKLQAGASGKSERNAASEAVSPSTGTKKTSLYLHSEAVKGLRAASQPQESAKPSTASSVIGRQAISLTTQRQTVTIDSKAPSSEVNTQLKAQQEFALNRLQEKSNRLRKSLAELRSQQTKNLSEASIGVAQPTNAVETTPQIQANSTQAEQIPASAQSNKSSLISSLKRAKAASAPLATPAPTTVKVATESDSQGNEVKAKDTLGVIPNNYGSSVSELVRANNQNQPNQQDISQKLMTPAPGVDRSSAQEPQLAPNPTVVPASASPKLVTTPVNTASTNLNLPVVSQLSTIADSTRITVPTPVATNDQISNNSGITTATVPSLSNSYGVGGDTPVPKVFGEIQQPKKSEKIARTKGNERLRTLQAEIERLREKYRAQQAGVPVPVDSETHTASVSIPVPSLNNLPISQPNPQRNAVPIPVPSPIGTRNFSVQPIKPLYGVTRPTNEPINPEFLPNKAPTQLYNASRGRLGTSPMGVNASDSLGRMRGSMVSPEFPPLAAVDQYLPKPIDETTPPPSTSTVAYAWPAKGVLTSGFGMRWGRPHKGIDIANAVGTRIFASADGVVEKAGWNNGGYGNLVDIRHPDGSMTRYGHNSKILVQVGQSVRQGETIALMGSTGFSTGPHTHFEIHPAGKGAVNPIALLANRI